MSEFSTPFVNNFRILLALNLKHSKWFVYNMITLIITFTLCRIVPIIPIWQKFYYFWNLKPWSERDDKSHVAYHFFTCISLDTLNLFWYMKMIDGSARWFKANPKLK
jgi:hypothetical protein